MCAVKRRFGRRFLKSIKRKSTLKPPIVKQKTESGFRVHANGTIRAVAKMDTTASPANALFRGGVKTTGVFTPRRLLRLVAKLAFVAQPRRATLKRVPAATGRGHGLRSGWRRYRFAQMTTATNKAATAITARIETWIIWETSTFIPNRPVPLAFALTIVEENSSRQEENSTICTNVEYSSRF